MAFKYKWNTYGFDKSKIWVSSDQLSAQGNKKVHINGHVY